MNLSASFTFFLRILSMEFKRLEKSKDVSSVFDKLQQSAANQASGSKYENLFLNSGNSGSNARGSMVRNLLKMKASVFMKKKNY